MDTSPPRGPLIPPIYFLAALAAMGLLHFFLPLTILLSSPYRFAGAGLIVLSLGAGFWAVYLFRRADTGVVPFTPATAFVASGPYRLTRNPMYLSMAGILLGTAIVLGSLAPLLVIPAFMALIEWRFILAEEAMLLAAFGEAYAGYKARVRRWL